MKTIALIILLPLFSLFWQPTPDKGLEKMLEEAQKFERQRKYKSAAELSVKIQNLARKQKKDIIYVQAVKIEVKANQWFEYENFNQALAALENHIDNPFGRTEALLRTYKIQAYYHWYQKNRYKLNDNADDGQINDLPAQWSKHDIWKLIDEEVKAVLKLSDDAKLNKEELKKFSQAVAIDGVKPHQIKDLALMTAIETLSYFEGDFQFLDKKLYAKAPDFISTFQKNEVWHPLALTARYFAFLLNNQDDLKATLAQHFNLQRLYKLYQKDEQYLKIKKYASALEPLIDLQNEAKTLAAARLGKIYNIYANQFYAKEKTQKANHWQQKAIKLCNEALKTYPKSYGAQQCNNLLDKIKAPEIQFQLEKYVLPGKNIPVRIAYKNQKWVKLIAHPITSTQYLKMQRTRNKGRRNKEKAAWSYQIDLPQKKGYFSRSIIDMLPSLPAGFYRIQFKTEKQVAPKKRHNTEILVNSTNLAAITRPRKNKTELRTINRTTGRIEKNTAAQLLNRRYDHQTRRQYYEIKKTLKTENGKISITKNERANYLKIFKNNDTLTVNYSANYLRSTHINIPKQIKFFTDRSIYRPGQTVYFKGIVSSCSANQWKPVTEKKVKVSFINTNHKNIKEQAYSVNQFGAFSGIFKIPQNTRPGQFRIRTSHGSHAFEVQNYKRPKFDVEWRQTNELVKPGETAHIDLHCQSFSGAPVKNAIVETSVKLQANMFKYWYPQTKSMVVAQFSDTTKQNGIAHISFQSLPDNGSQNYSISSKVTLPDGSTRTFQHQYTVSPYPVSITIPGPSVRRAKNPIKLNIKGINGEPVNEQMKLEVKALNTPKSYFYQMPFSKANDIKASISLWQKQYPGMAFNDTLIPANIPLGKTMLTHSAEGINMQFPDNKSLGEGWYAFRFYLSDTLYQTKYIKIADTNTKNNHIATPLALFADKTKVKPGDKINFHVTSAFKDAKINVLISDKEGVVSEKHYEITNKKQAFEIPVQKRSEGKLKITAIVVKNGREFEVSKTISVKPVSRQIDIEFTSIRDFITPGETETWEARLTQNGSPVENAAMLAAMYDMSLDAFRPHRWQLPFQHRYSGINNWETTSFGLSSSYYNALNQRFSPAQLKWYIHNPFNGRYGGHKRPMAMHEGMKRSNTATEGTPQTTTDEKKSEVTAQYNEKTSQAQQTNSKKDTKQSIAVRSNFNETAFFYPDLRSQKNGKVSFEFQVPESMTKWKLQVLAHNKDMAAGYKNHEVITQKPLMVLPNRLRFVHRGDHARVGTMVYNLTDSTITVKPAAKITNAITGKTIKSNISESKLQIAPQASAAFTVLFEVPDNLNALNYQITGKSGSHADGELHGIPVLPSRQTLINTMVFWNKPNEKRQYKFNSLEKLQSNTARAHKLSFELTTNPLWFAIKSMPSVYKPAGTSSIQISRNYRVTVWGEHLIQKHESIARVFKIWKESQPEALQSKLNKNEDLKNLLLSETPWEEIAADETLQRSMLMEILNPNYVKQQMQSSVRELAKQQHSSGAFSWRPGMRASYYFTLQTVRNLSQTLDIQNRSSKKARKIIENALPYLKQQLEKRYHDLLRYSTDTAEYSTPVSVMQYFLIACKFDSKYRPKTEAEKYFFRHALQYKKRGLYAMVVSGEVARLLGNKKFALTIIDRLRERAVVDEEKGIFWKKNQHGWNMDEAPVGTQAAIIDLYSKMKQPLEEIEAMKLWLIRQKQGQAWQNSDATISAINALLHTGKNWLQQNKPVTISVGNLTIKSDEVAAEAGTGYFRKNINDPKPAMEKIIIDNPNETPVWGGIYHQYTESYANIKPWQDELSIKRDVYVVKQTNQGEKLKAVDNNQTLNAGQQIRIKLNIQSNRNLDYVSVISPGAACLEPANQMSGYKWSSGLSYYAEIHDSEYRFFLRKLNSGNSTIQYDMYVTRSGFYQAGAAEVQSAYAPEFGAHSSGYKLNVQ